MNRRGFTMLELLLAVSILAVMTVVVFFTFHTIVRCWTRTTELSARYQQSDYAIEQVVAALRSAYYPNAGKQIDQYGFMLMDDGDGEDAKDSIQWTKLGPAIIGNKTKYSSGPHTVRLRIADGRFGDAEANTLLYAVKGDLDAFEDPDKYEFGAEDDEFYEWKPVTGHIQGFNCRVADKTKPYKDDGSWNWQDEWSTSNCIPMAVELTFWMEPVKERAEPESIVRVVEIPLAWLSQNPIENDKETKKGAGGKGGKGGGAGGGAGGGGGGAGK